MAAKVLRICDYERKCPQWAYPRDHQATFYILPVAHVDLPKPIRRANHKRLPPAFVKPSK